MLNDSHGQSKVRVGSAGNTALNTNRDAKNLRQGDIVKPNFQDAQALRDHPCGAILRINGGSALVRWERELNEEKVDTKHLIKVGR